MFQAKVRACEKASKFKNTENNSLGCMVRSWRNKLPEEEPSEEAGKGCSDCQLENPE